MKLEYDKLEAALDLAKRQRVGGTEYTMNAVTVGDMEELIKRAKIVDDLASKSPTMEYHGVDYCQLCDREQSRYDDKEHEDDCPWRRAKELQS